MNERDSVEARLDALDAKVSELLSHQRRQAELIDELRPVLRAMTDAGVARLGELEERGYFAFGAELVRVADRVVGAYTDEDVRAFGDAIVGILDTVRHVTQPEVLAVARDAADAARASDRVQARGVLGILGEARDREVQRGIAVALEVLRRVGRGAAGARSRQAGSPLAAMLAPRLAPSPSVSNQPASRRASAPAPRAASPAAASAAPAAAEVLAFVADGEWSRAYAESRAADSGVVGFGDAHWAVVEFARAEHASAGQSPNVRRITTGTGLTTKQLYTLFPRAPGVTIARCAGIPKPVGCL
ncbi:MAG: TusE/DsrC/DsvC family sulfur relay protein [Myxococcales bacterium]|nr:TusE/DsrC/DsvC family sulfur relay protein [Myxococcales bacterium]MCB9534185.1 TusE/DsrC/DsvC family sulfur relay protein [Myxococcales bacterium]